MADEWFVLNARDAQWRWAEGRTAVCDFEENGEFPQLGLNVSVVQPGEFLGMYHWEADQEDFLVLSGECLLLIEGEERRLRAWDFVHCPAWTEHVFVGAGDGPCAILAVGARASRDVVYPEAEVAQKHGAGVAKATRDGKEAYAAFREDVDVPYTEGWLP